MLNSKVITFGGKLCRADFPASRSPGETFDVPPSQTVRLISSYQTAGKDGDLEGDTVVWRTCSCDSALLHPHRDSSSRLGAYVNKCRNCNPALCCELVLFFFFFFFLFFLLSHVHKRSFSVRPDLEQRHIMRDNNKKNGYALTLLSLNSNLFPKERYGGTPEEDSKHFETNRARISAMQ